MQPPTKRVFLVSLVVVVLASLFSMWVFAKPASPSHGNASTVASQATASPPRMTPTQQKQSKTNTPTPNADGHHYDAGGTASELHFDPIKHSSNWGGRLPGARWQMPSRPNAPPLRSPTVKRRWSLTRAGTRTGAVFVLTAGGKYVSHTTRCAGQQYCTLEQRHRPTRAAHPAGAECAANPGQVRHSRPAAIRLGRCLFLALAVCIDPNDQALTRRTSGIELDPATHHPRLRNITPPASGNALYAWLRLDPGQDEVKPILLGQLAVKAGHAHLTYKSPTHEDLLVTFSRFLVTEQDAKTVPVTPPLNSATRRYQATIPTIPNPADEQHHYTVLDHLRHLPARDPTVASIGLAGGLNIWLYRNSLEVMEEATTARDYWQYKSSTPYMHRQIVRLLDYLDGYNDALHDVPLIDPFTHSESGFLIDRKYGELRPAHA